VPAERVPRPFVDGPPGSIDDTTALARAAAARWGLAEPQLARVSMNAIYTAGPVVLRVSRPTAPAAAAIALAEVLAAHDIRVPAPARDDVVERDGLMVTAWQRLIPVDEPTDWADVGRMVARVHDLGPAMIPADYPVPPCEAFPWWDLDGLLDELRADIDEGALAGLTAAVERNRGWATGVERVVCHGDVHPGNVVMSAVGPVLLDWDLLCRGPRGWDHAMLLRLPRWGWPASWYDDFADGYGCSLADEPVTNAIAELRLVAATLMRLRAGRSDPAAMPEAQRRLHHWRGDPDAPPFTAV
jgi:Ser/Thr protein kinase RdoA (MazF antagonist)